MATPTIPNGEEYFFPIIYEGNGAGQRVGKFVPFTDNGTIANSCIFEKGDSPRLNRTPSGTGTSRRKYTLSLWAKPSLSSTASDERYMITAGAYGSDDLLSFDADRTLKYWINGRSNGDFKTNRTFEDSSKFYHILVSVDTTQATASDRVKIYVDGDQITSFSLETYPAQDYDGNWGNAVSTNIGSSNSPNRYYNGYLAEVNYVDGTALGPSTFGLTDTSTGRWIPKTLSGITYGTNGFRLEFGDSSALGDDTSGNTNDFTATNLASTDQTTDSPSQNHATFDSNRNGGDWTLSEGNLKIVGTPSTGAGRICLSGMNVPNSNKIYWEVEGDAMNDAPRYLGIFRDTVSLTAGSSTEDMRYISIRAGGTQDGKVWDGTSTSSQLTTFSAGDIIQFARDGKKLWIGKNNTWLNSGNPSTGANPLLTNIDTNSNWKMGVYSVSTGIGGASHTFIANTGQRTFSYTPPTGFSAWNQDNLPETAKGISGLVWTKNRDSTDSHQLYDSSRGKQLVLASNAASAEATVTDGLQRFLAGGQQIEDSDAINTSGESFVTWNWVANGGTTATNNDGSQTSTTQANTTSGFSIVTYAGTSSGTATIGHGLSSTPEWIVIKNLTDSRSWFVYHKGLSGANYYVRFDNVAGEATGDVFNNTAPTSSVFSIQDAGSLNTNGSGKNYLALCWHSVSGFSKFGSYTGNGNADGPFVYLGFKPAWIMIKQRNSTGSWIISDNKRNIFNPIDKLLRGEGNNTESTFTSYDMLSNGFKQRNTDTGFNGSGSTYIYMAFAEHPFVGDGTSPVTAR